MKDEGRLIRSPEITQGTHIIEWLSELGLYENGANGPQPLDHKEIRSWSELMKVDPLPAEVRLIRSLSSEFCSFYYQCDNDTPEPMREEMTDEEFKFMQQQMRAARRARRGR